MVQVPVPEIMVTTPVAETTEQTLGVVVANDGAAELLPPLVPRSTVCWWARLDTDPVIERAVWFSLVAVKVAVAVVWL